MSMKKKQRAGSYSGLNPWDKMSFEEQEQFIADYNKERSMRGQLEKRLDKLETVVKNLQDKVNKYKNIATGAVGKMRSKLPFTRKGGKYSGMKKRRTTKKKRTRKKHRRKY